MNLHAFVDESQRGRYLVCAALVAPRDLVGVRRDLRAMLLPGQRRLHFAHERPQRRRSLLAKMAKLPISTRMYTSIEKEPVARRRCLAMLLRELMILKGERIVIERREVSQDARERRQMALAIQSGDAPAGLHYHHMGGHEEPLLWVADAVAWAYGAGGEWRQRVSGLVELVRDADAQAI